MNKDHGFLEVIDLKAFYYSNEFEIFLIMSEEESAMLVDYKKVIISEHVETLAFAKNSKVKILFWDKIKGDLFFVNVRKNAFLSERYAEWKKMRRRYLDGRISFEEYWEWKLKRTDKGEGANE